MADEKISVGELLKFIKQFEKKYQVVPSPGFLAGYFKTSRQLIYDKLDKLEEEGKVERVIKTKYHTNYKLKL